MHASAAASGSFRLIAATMRFVPRCCTGPLPSISSKKLPGTTVDMLRITDPRRGERANASSVRRNSSLASCMVVGESADRELLLRVLQTDEIVVAGALGRAPRRQSVDEPEQLVVVAQRVFVEPVHERAAVRRDGQPALAVERDDRLAHGDATDAEPLGDVVLAHAVALTQLTVEDHRPDVHRDEIAAAAPVDEGERREALVVEILHGHVV